ncbi:MAG: hypothetical protein ACRCU5_08210 [Rhizobiaceae bacterium]
MRTKIIAAAVCLSLAPSLAFAKSARCFTTDDGYFPCNFTATDGNGSFDIQSLKDSGMGYSIIVEEPGFASGYVRINGRGIPVNGMFVRQRDDGACWNNPEMNVKVCAW